jgi:hypothetical protein
MERKPTAKVAREVRERVAALARVQRPELLDWLLSDYWKAEALTGAVIKDAASRRYYHGDAGWRVPVGSIGRKGAEAVATEKDARSAAESIRLWIIKNLSDIIPADAYAVVVEPDGDGWCIVVYRKG